MPIIDAHRHLFTTPELETDQILREMDEYDIEKTILLPIDGIGEFMGRQVGGQDVVERAVEEHPDRLVGAIYVDPRNPGAVERIHRLAQKDFRAVKMWSPIGFWPDDEAWNPVYEAIASCKLPIIAHTGITDIPVPGIRKAAHSKYSEIILFDGLVRRFPEITWVFAHSGDPHFTSAIMMAAANENAFLNPIGGVDSWDARLITEYEAMGRVWPLPFNKLVWGSDNLSLDGAHDYWRNLFERNDAGEHLDKFFYDNAERIFGPL